jgi:TetR/AcrR family transcriptional regulator
MTGASTRVCADHATQLACFRDAPAPGVRDESDRRNVIDQVTEFLLKGSGVK